LKKVIISVTNDLVSDQRVNRSCVEMHNLGFNVLLIGRKLRNSPDLQQRIYNTHRMKLLFEKGFLFYAEYNIRLFLFLLFKKCDILFANDLDTLLANYLIKKVKRVPLIYDSHEYYTETPELVNRPRVQAVWKRIERRVFPKLKYVFTVNQSIALLFEKEYKVNVRVMRNVPFFRKPTAKYSRKELGIPDNEAVIILQGAGINIQRGAEELVEAMTFINNAILLIVGNGDVIDTLKETVKKKSLSKKIIFFPRQDFEHLHSFTVHSEIGFSLDKNTNINYRFSLPNKIFDYIQAGTAVLASKLPEVEKVVNDYNIGEIIPDHNPEKIAQSINEMLNNKQKLELYQQNCLKSASKLCWENEKRVLTDVLLELKHAK